MHKPTDQPHRNPPRKVIAVDVDGTLHRDGVVREFVIFKLRELHAAGFEMFLWSARGADYARKVATDLGIADLFAHILTKPGYILDDEGWLWTRYTQRLMLNGGAT